MPHINPDDVEGWRGEIEDGEVILTHDEAVREEQEDEQGDDQSEDDDDDDRGGRQQR